MNDPGFFEFAASLDKLIKTSGLEQVFKRCTGREPRPDEAEVLQRLDTLTQARVLLNLDETITRE
jgi:hypothetical protein